MNGKICSCGNIIVPYYHFLDLCEECRKKKRQKEKLEYLTKLEVQLGLEPNNIELIEGGCDQDNDVQAFNDYFDTILRMKTNLEKRECRPPFTIISHQEVFNHAGMENNVSFIAIQYNPEVEIENLWDINDKPHSIKKVVINERDYILSQKWIKTWKINNNLGKIDTQADYRLMLTDGIKVVITGWLTLT